MMTEKQQARAAARQRLRALDAGALARAGREIARQLFARPEWQRADTVFCFVPMASEADVTPVLCQALAEGKRLCVPRMLGGGQMELVEITSLDQLRPNRYGIREPEDGRVIPPDRLGRDALALVPCLAASRQGVRLGRGGGYYDRFLAGFAGRALLVCPRALLFDTLPADSWDARFDPGDLLLG